MKYFHSLYILRIVSKAMKSVLQSEGICLVQICSSNSILQTADSVVDKSQWPI